MDLKPQHVKGNEAADNLAKEVALGQFSAMVDLPHILRNPLPVSTSTLKQKYLAKLKELWHKTWEISPWKNRIEQLGDGFPFSNHCKQLCMLTRRQSSLILQLKSTHFPLNTYLHILSKSDTDNAKHVPKITTSH